MSSRGIMLFKYSAILLFTMLLSNETGVHAVKSCSKQITFNGMDDDDAMSELENFLMLHVGGGSTVTIDTKIDFLTSETQAVGQTQCPPVVKRDIVFAVDSSRSIKTNEWNAIKTLLVDVIRTFDISDDSLQVAFFRFNRQIDAKTQVLFGDYQTKEELIDRLRKLPKNGGGTFIGRALRHARNNVLTVKNRPNAPDMVVMITDGASQDQFNDTAKELRDSGVQIVALGIFKNRRAEMLLQLIKMTGHEDLVVQIDDLLTSPMSKLVVDKILEGSCE